MTTEIESALGLCETFWEELTNTPQDLDAFLQQTFVPDINSLAQREPRLDPLARTVAIYSGNFHHWLTWPEKDVTWELTTAVNQMQQDVSLACGALTP